MGNGLERPIEEQREEFKKRKLMAIPIAGMLVWGVVGILSFYLSPIQQVWSLYIGTGSIVYLGLFISKFTGENLLDKTKPKNTFDNLFYISTATALVVFSIAIPFAGKDYTSLPLSIGILTGLMWMPLSWIIEHPLGFIHTLTRTAGILFVWYAFPDNRFSYIPAVIVLVYLVSLFQLNKRWKEVNS